MKIGLYGIFGVYNFGCEAIIRGAYRFIHNVYPGSQIVYFSYSPDFDSKVLSDLDIEIYPVKTTRSIQKRVVNKVLKATNAPHRCLMINADALIDYVDMFISIGGDIYTIPAVLRNNEKYPYYNALVDFCDRAITKGKQVIVYGASVGPWGNYKKAVEYNVKALNKYKAILCREEKTVSYLNQLGIKDAFFFPDPAFQVKCDVGSGEKQYIGINFSPLSLNEVHGSYREYIVELAKLVDTIYDTYKIDILFIPHVLSNNENDNDLWYMEKINEYMEHKDHVIYADTSRGFLGLKPWISKCYMVIAARMHCAVNAVVQNVPTIFVYYSQKAIGMCKYVYGNEQMAVDLKNISEELLPVVKITFDNKEKLTAMIEHRNAEIAEYYDQNIISIQKLLKM